MATKTGTRKISRNARCHCGSGKKYKRCCLPYKDRGNDPMLFDAGRQSQLPGGINRLAPFIPRQRRVKWKRVFCEVPLEGGGSLDLTLACTARFIKENGIGASAFIHVRADQIQFDGPAFVMLIEDAPEPGNSEGELLVAMKRENPADFGVMIYGKGKLARVVLERRRKRSRQIDLVMEKPDGGRVDIGLLRFVDWIEAHKAEVGKEIFLDLGHMGARGFARVVAIKTCPPGCFEESEDSSSRFVTGTFRHSSGEVYDLKLESESKPIGVTATHPFWSVDRQDWVSAINLQIGETLDTVSGTTRVEGFTKRPGREPVYNVEVEGDHCYRVGESGVLVHNSSIKPDNPCDCVTLDVNTGGSRPMTAEEKEQVTEYARRVNEWLDNHGPVVVQRTAGALTNQANAARDRERRRAERAGTPYEGVPGHVPDTALSGSGEPPAGWLDMTFRANSKVGGGLGPAARLGKCVNGFTVDGSKP